MSFHYLASPYSKFPRGIDEAYREICVNQALLIKHGIPVFCPISHTHGPARHGGIDPLDHNVWIPADMPFMHAAKSLIVCMMDSWQESYGIQVEMRYFFDNGRPIYKMEPGKVTEELLEALRR